MKTLEQSIACSMDCEDTALLPFLPYILQDFFEIGSSPGVILNLIRRNNTACSSVLDIGCGKGAVSIALASGLGCSCIGIDAIPEFIREATHRAESLDLSSRCSFRQGDARKEIESLGMFDTIVLGSIGPVFGNCFETLTAMDAHLEDKGIVIFDDGTARDDQDPNLPSRNRLLEQITRAGMKILDEMVADDGERIRQYKVELRNLTQRCHELICLYPEQKRLFEDYIEKQKMEYKVLETGVICSTLVIGRK